MGVVPRWVDVTRGRPFWGRPHGSRPSPPIPFPSPPSHAPLPLYLLPLLSPMSPACPPSVGSPPFPHLHCLSPSTRPSPPPPALPSLPAPLAPSTGAHRGVHQKPPGKREQGRKGAEEQPPRRGGRASPVTPTHLPGCPHHRLLSPSVPPRPVGGGHLDRGGRATRVDSDQLAGQPTGQAAPVRAAAHRTPHLALSFPPHPLQCGASAAPTGTPTYRWAQSRQPTHLFPVMRGTPPSVAVPRSVGSVASA